MRSPKLKGYELGADLGCKVQWRIRQIKMVSYVERFLDCWLGKNPLWQLYGEGVSEKGKGKKEIIRCPDVVLRRTDPYYKFGYVCLRLASAACSTFTLFFPTALYMSSCCTTS